MLATLKNVIVTMQQRLVYYLSFLTFQLLLHVLY